MTVRRTVLAPPDAAVIVTFESNPLPPTSTAEWAEQRIDALGTRASWDTGKVLAQLLRAGDDHQAVKAAVAAGNGLDPWNRYAVGQVLEEYRALARDEFPQAAGMMDHLRSAWVKHYGSEQPRALPQVRELPAAGTGASEPHGGWPPVPEPLRGGTYRRDGHGIYRRAG
jgi:hypothetical protein